MSLRGPTPPVSVAPMMDRTDRHYRFFLRLVSRHTLLYTEMVPARAILRGDRDRLLAYDPSEHPLALQTGGDDPAELADVARIAEDLGFDELNLNVGCPSSRVQTGNFGACLMRTPALVARGVTAMRAACTLPVTVKHRIGVDELDHYDHMRHFVDVVADAGCDRFSVHARKAWLQGLSPKENRNVPPLRYDDVYRLKQERPDLPVELNGGVKSWAGARGHLDRVDAVMIGRWAYDQPWSFSTVDRDFFGSHAPPVDRASVVAAMTEYAARYLRDHPHGRVGHVARHMMGLYAGEPGARTWRRSLSEQAFRGGAGPEVLETARVARQNRSEAT
jgi:tRNA-dihydrouridine synthase A